MVSVGDYKFGRLVTHGVFKRGVTTLLKFGNTTYTELDMSAGDEGGARVLMEAGERSLLMGRVIRQLSRG